MPILDSALAIAPTYRSRVWGGQTLASRFGRSVPQEKHPIGESWELCDFASDLPDNGSARSKIVSGVFKGQTLEQLRKAYPKELMGDLSVNPKTGGFPLLLKYLDASSPLSVQVHPSPAYAKAHSQAHLKSEAWFIVDCAPGAVIYKGLKKGVNANDLRSALKVNTREAVLALMETIPVQAGDCHYLPSGTCHALGEGILVAEVQTPSDTTFRVYDWGRVGRELHIEQAMACIDFSGAPLPPMTQATKIAGHSRVITCDFFHSDYHYLTANQRLEAKQGNKPVAWMVLGGSLVTTDGQHFKAGDTLLWPAACTKRLAQAGVSGAAVLETFFS